MSLILGITWVVIFYILSLALADAVDRFGEWLRDVVVEWLDRPQ